MKDMFSEALMIASKAHYGVLDKGGHPYIKHPLKVYEGVRDDGGSINAQIVAILHDVVEDSDVTSSDLLVAGFNMDVIRAMRLLTHVVDSDFIDRALALGMSKEEAAEKEYLKYITEIKANPIARLVKKHDLRHNSDITRVPVEMIHTGKFIKRLEKYIKAYNLLMQED